MNFIDIAILLVFAIAIMGGIYRGFVDALLNLGATVLSLVVSFLVSPFVSNGIKSNEFLYNQLLYYTEGSEYVATTNVELTRVPVSQISSEQLKTVIENADMPIPMGRSITKNVAAEVFARQDITTLGDYFNQTIVAIVTNIVSILLVFLVLRLILGLVIRSIEYGRHGFPALTKNDALLGVGIGFIEGILILFVIFMVLPIVLTVLPKIYDYVSDSVFGDFFYRANFLLYLVPTT